MRSVIYGLLAGALLSLLRVPAGFDAFDIPAPSAASAYGVRTLALALVGFTLAAAATLRQPAETTRLLVGLTAGYAAHGLLLADRLAVGSRTGLVVWAGLGTVALLFARPRAVTKVDGPEGPTGAEEPSASLLELAGLGTAGAGAAIAVEALARWVRLLGASVRDDDTVFGATFLTLASLGALSFGWMAVARRARGLALPVGLVGTAAATTMGFQVIGHVGNARGLDRYFRHPLLRWTGVDGSMHGALPYDALIGGSCLVAVGLVLGFALCGADRRSRLASSVIGAAVGLRMVPVLMARGLAAATDGETFDSVDLVPVGAAVAGVGAAVALLFRPQLGPTRWIGIVAAVVLAAVPRIADVHPHPPLSPWERAVPIPRLIVDTPEGLITVEASRTGVEAITLDRQPLGPPGELAAGDALRLQTSMGLLDELTAARSEADVLLVGQLTPGRRLRLGALGARRIDRTGAWWRTMERIEEELFQGGALPDGEILSPDDARRNVEAGEYHLVLIPAVPRDPPPAPDRRLGELQAPAETTLVAWFSAVRPLGHLDLGTNVVLSADGLFDLALGVVRGPALPSRREEGRPLLAPAGDPSPAPTPLVPLLERPEERANWTRALTGARLARAAQGTELEQLTRGLAAFLDAQKRSSPFENPADQIELPDETMEELRRAVVAGPLDDFSRGLWEGLADLLVAKRWIPQIYEHLEPVGDRYPEWIAVQRSLAHADLESLDPESAHERIQDLPRLAPERIDTWLYLAEAQRQTGQHAGAAESYRRALEFWPDDLDLERALAIELVRASDPEGLELVRSVLERLPEDEELRKYLGPGPLPPPDTGFRPSLFSRAKRHADHDH